MLTADPTCEPNPSTYLIPKLGRFVSTKNSDVLLVGTMKNRRMFKMNIPIIYGAIAYPTMLCVSLNEAVPVTVELARSLLAI